MKILYLHRTQAKGVEGVHIGEIVKSWRRSGHVVQVISPVDGPEYSSGNVPASEPAKSNWRRRLLAGVSANVPELLFEIAEILYNLFTLGKLFKVRRLRPDLIFERYAIFAVAGAWTAALWRVPFVLEVNYTSRSELVRQRSKSLRALAFRADQFVFRRATGLVAVSSRLMQHLVADYAIPSERILVLPNAADPDVFDPETVRPATSLGDLSGRFIGFVGGFYPWHGLDILIEAFCLIFPKIPDAKLLLVGDGPMRAQVAADCVRLGVASRVIMTGAVGHDVLPGYVRLFHVGVMPDSNDYGSPMKIFEYMALAKPVVVPDYGPLRDVIVDGQQGYIFPPRNPVALAERLSMLLTDPTLYARMSENARNSIVNRHNWLENSRRILSLLSGKKQ